MPWDDKQKAEVVEKYLAESPTPETSMEIVQAIADEIHQTPNGVRMILTKAGVYIKKDGSPAATTKAPAAGGAKTASTRVSKEDSHGALINAITAAGLPVDSDIIAKLTGKAAVYFTSLFAK